MDRIIAEIIENLNRNRQVLLNTLKELKNLIYKIDETMDKQLKTIDKLETLTASFEVQDIIERIHNK